MQIYIKKAGNYYPAGTGRTALRHISASRRTAGSPRAEQH